MPRPCEAQLHLVGPLASNTLVLPNQILHIRKSSALQSQLVPGGVLWKFAHDFPQVNAADGRNPAFVLISLREAFSKCRRTEFRALPLQLGIEAAQRGRTQRSHHI